MTQLSDTSEEVLLIAIESQSEALNEMEHEDLLKKLGMQEEAETWGGKDSGLEMESEMMKAKKDRELVQNLKNKRDIKDLRAEAGAVRTRTLGALVPLEVFCPQ